MMPGQPAMAGMGLDILVGAVVVVNHAGGSYCNKHSQDSYTDNDQDCCI